jgi:hypothetical protein
MAIITRSFKITSTTLQDVFTADTDVTIIGFNRTNTAGNIFTKLFDSTGTGYDVPVIMDSNYNTKITIFLPQGSIVRYSSIAATVSAPEYLNITYYYEDSLTDTINAVGVWNTSTTYTRNSIVYRDTNNTSYIANITNTNKPPESSSGYWQILAGQNTDLNITLSNELTSNTTGFLTGATTTLGIASTLTNKTLSGITRFSNDRFYDSTGAFYYQLPTGSSGTLVDTDSSQTITSKTLENCTINNATLQSPINFTAGSILNLNNSYILDSIQTYSSSYFTSNNFSWGSQLQGITKLTTPTTTSAVLSITLPTISSSNTGASGLIFVTMGAANQTISWNNVKVAGSVTASQTANATDIYSVVNDGTYWYLTLLDKGFV